MADPIDIFWDAHLPPHTPSPLQRERYNDLRRCDYCHGIVERLNPTVVRTPTGYRGHDADCFVLEQADDIANNRLGAPVTKIDQPGHGFTLATGEIIPVHLDSPSGLVVAAQADDPNTLADAFLIGIDGDCLMLQFAGIVEVGAHSTLHEYAWLDPDVPSGVVTIKPTVVGNYQQMLGQWVSATEFHIDIEQGFEVVAPLVLGPDFPTSFMTTTGPTTPATGETWVIDDVAHVITLPSPAADGDYATLIPNDGPWSSSAYSILTSDTSTVFAGQTPFAADFSTLIFTYDAANDNWIVTS